MTTPARADEWDRLGATWRAQPAGGPLPIESLRAIVRRRQLEMSLIAAGEVALTAAVVGMALRLLRGGINRASVTGTVLIVLWTAVVWAFTTWNRRGTWRPLGETTMEYLRLSRRRIAAGRRTITFVRGSVGVSVVAYGAVLAARGARPLDRLEVSVWLSTAAICALLLGWSVWYARLLSRELERVARIERSLGLADAA